jgi:hypothetical protein
MKMFKSIPLLCTHIYFHKFNIVHPPGFHARKSFKNHRKKILPHVVAVNTGYIISVTD